MFLHEHAEFEELIRIVSAELSILPQLVEKDYWVTHCLWGLTQSLQFELKGGTSLSKGFGIIDRFSEDIDIRINLRKVWKSRQARATINPHTLQPERSTLNGCKGQSRFPASNRWSAIPAMTMTFLEMPASGFFTIAAFQYLLD